MSDEFKWLLKEEGGYSYDILFESTPTSIRIFMMI